MMTDEKALVFIKERLYDRRQALLSDIDVLVYENKETYNPHDYPSGFYRGTTDQMKNELDFIEKLINDIENYF